jgi:TonB family protein
VKRALFKYLIVAGLLGSLPLGQPHLSLDRPRSTPFHGVIEQVVPTQNGFDVTTILVRKVAQNGFKVATVLVRGLAENSPTLISEAYFRVNKYSTSVFEIYEKDSAWCTYESLRNGQEVLVWFSGWGPDVTYPLEFGAGLIGIVREGTVRAADFKNFPKKRDVEPMIRVGRLRERALRKPDPGCPEEAMTLRQPQMVLVEVVIDEEGSVEDAAVVQGHPSLIEAGLETARQWRFKPSSHDGSPVKVIGVIPLMFCREDK